MRSDDAEHHRRRGTRGRCLPRLGAGGAAVGALVGQLVWGQWFLGALAGCLLAWFALPTGIGEANRRLWRPFYRPTPPTGREREED